MKNALTRLVSSAVLLAIVSCGNSKRDEAPVAHDTVATDSTDAVKSADTLTVAPASAEDLGIPAGTAGVWVEDAANVDVAGADAESAITLCEGGRASYAVFSNQLFVFMRVSRRATSEGDVFSFHYDGEDVGSGFRNVSLRTPAPGVLLGTGKVEGEGAGVLVMDWKAGEDYIASVRSSVRGAVGGRTIFPQKFYHNFIAMAGLCEETD